MIIKLVKMGNISQDIIPHHINFSAITAEDYDLVYDIIQKVKEEEFPELHLNACQIEDELNKVSSLCLSTKTVLMNLKYALPRRLLLGKEPLKCPWKSMLFQKFIFISESVFS